MPITQIRLSNVRSYELFSAELDPQLTLLLGRNGTGKTSLLEGLYYLLYGTSFRGRDRDMIAINSTRAELALEFDDGTSRRATLQQTATDTIKKTFVVQGKTSQRLSARQRMPVVLFEPDELRLITSSPERRRRFFDGILSRLYPQYATILNRYNRILLQRNELLKKREDLPANTWEDQLFVWDLKFAEAALEITRQRREFVVMSNSHLSHKYSSMADAPHRISVSYHSSLSGDNYQQELLNYLHRNRVGDSYRGYTTGGPHRDDFLLTLDGRLASETASRGEMRTIMLSYKLLEVDMQQELHDTPPLILLDDVFSELDHVREQHLMHTVLDYQTIITATNVRKELSRSATIINL